MAKLDPKYDRYIAKRKMLTFSMAAGLFAVEVDRVQEIIEGFHITSVPKLPGYIRGIYNQRGSLIPVVDLRKKLNLRSSGDLNHREGLIILEVFSDRKSQTLIGVIVDHVQEVIECRDESVDRSLQESLGVDSRYITGFFTAGEGDPFVILLDCDVMLAPEELAEAAGAPYFWSGEAAPRVQAGDLIRESIRLSREASEVLSDSVASASAVEAGGAGAVGGAGVSGETGAAAEVLEQNRGAEQLQVQDPENEQCGLYLRALRIEQSL